MNMKCFEVMSQVMMATAAFVGSVVLIGSINKLGKRSLALASTAICALSCLLLGLYGYLFVAPVGTVSGDASNLTATWVPLVLLAIIFFGNAIQGQIPWLLVAEAFPFR
jgi:Na+/melibiose symporter-like transporter